MRWGMRACGSLPSSTMAISVTPSAMFCIKSSGTSLAWPGSDPALVWGSASGDAVEARAGVWPPGVRSV